MNKELLRASRQKGVIFGIALIFLMLINFHIMAATMISKLMGTNVLRGAIPEVPGGNGDNFFRPSRGA